MSDKCHYTVKTMPDGRVLLRVYPDFKDKDGWLEVNLPNDTADKMGIELLSAARGLIRG